MVCVAMAWLLPDVYPLVFDRSGMFTGGYESVDD